MDLPHLSINMAMTLDGKVVLPDGRWHGLSSPEDRRRMGIIRKKSDALIMGVNSIENDDPNPGVFDGEGPVPVIIARNHIPEISRKIFQNARTILYTREEIIRNHYDEYDSLCSIRIRDLENLTPRKVLQDLWRSGFKNVLLEGGPALNYAFFRDDLVSEINVTIVPFLIGKRNLPGIVDGEDPFTRFEMQKWSVAAAEAVNDEIFLVYRRKSDFSSES